MLLTERSDFQGWLRGLQSACDALGRVGLAPPADQPNCRRCGSEFDDFHSCGYCIVCLAEQFGTEQAEEAAVVGRSVLVALLTARDVHPDALRATVERVLDEYAASVEACSDAC